MPAKQSHITITDQFCGAGGSSQGVKNYAAKVGGGVEVKLALNHWKLAIETHNTNFPDTLHDCTDISASDPRRYPSTDGLITSPECTNHSLASGKKKVKAQMDMFEKGILDASAERSRATMWDVPRFAEYHQYNFIIVENVVDARKWIMFDPWLNAMHVLGYLHECVYINSKHCHPTPQSRDRMYVVFWKKGNKKPNLEFTPKAHCAKCSKDIEALQWFKKQDKKFGKFRQQYLYRCPECTEIVEPYYYAAFNAIDWSDLGTKIGDRKKPLSENTIKRIEYGLKKFKNDPLLIHALYGKEARGVSRSVNNPFFTQVTLNTQAVVSPFIIKGEHTLQNGYVKNAVDHFQTQTVRQSMSLVTPFITTNKGKSMSHHAAQPITMQTQALNHGIVTDESFKSFLSYYYKSHQASGINEATGSITTKDRLQLITYQKPKIEDCYYRMIKAHEVKRAMAFNEEYVILGNSRDQVKQCRNAVTPPVMEWLTQRCVESLN